MANDHVQGGETRGRARPPGEALFQKLTIGLTGPFRDLILSSPRMDLYPRLYVN